MSGSPAAITGWGAISPLGVGADALFERWCEGVNGLEGGLGHCEEFDPTGRLSDDEMRRSDRFVQMALVAYEEAVATAWPDGCPYDPERVACLMGSALGTLKVLEEREDILNHSQRWVEAPIGMIAHAAPSAISTRGGFRGGCASVMAACASSAQAIGAGLHMLRRDEADAVIVGGSESSLVDLTRASFGQAGALSPTGVSCPFDRRRDGFVLAEGTGILVLEQPERARERGAEVLGQLLGYASTSDAHHITAPEQDGICSSRAMRLAVEDAGIEPEDIDYINAHGTSTPLNDRSEVLAIKRALGDAAFGIPVSSTKSVIGHSLGAAGATEAVATLEALRNRTAGPTMNLEEPDDDLDLDFVPNEPRPIPKRRANGSANGSTPRIALSNSFAFGGHNAVLVLSA